jgi:hypothetical protein
MGGYRIRIAVWLLAFDLIALWCLFGRFGPWVAYHAYLVQARITESSRLAPCAYCGRPGHPVTVQKPGDLNVLCDLHSHLPHSPDDPKTPGNRIILGFILICMGCILPSFFAWESLNKESLLGPRMALVDKRTPLTTKEEKDFDGMVALALGLGGASLLADAFMIWLVGSLAGSHRVTVPMFGRFLNAKELAVFALAVGLWNVYAFLMLYPISLVFGSKGKSVSTLRKSAERVFAYVVSFVVGASLAAGLSFGVRLLWMFFFSAANDMTQEIAHESGPGLSRAFPYGIAGAGFLFLLVIATTAVIFVAPVLLSKLVLSRLKPHSNSAELA